MKEPYIYINVFDGALHIGKKLPSESKPRELFDISVTNICSDGLEVASNKLGSTILGILKIWHEDSFSALENSTNLHSVANTAATFDAALLLIEKFATGAPEIYLNLVDDLLADAASGDAFAKEYLHTDWPPLRRRLLATGNS